MGIDMPSRILLASKQETILGRYGNKGGHAYAALNRADKILFPPSRQWSNG